MKTVMENQDKLYQQFKDASGKAEDKGFDRMEAVWNRVEEKLDNKKQRKIAIWWKYTGIAALFLLFMGIGTFMFKNENNPIVAPKAIPENNVTVIDTQKVKQTFNSEIKGFKQEVVTSEPAPRSKVEQIQSAPNQPEPIDKVSVDYVPEPAVAAIQEKSAIRAKMAAPTIATDTTEGIAFQGTVTDKAGMPIPGAVIAFDGTKKGVQTDFDGKFTLNVNEGDKIALSYMDMEPQSVIVGRATNNTTFIMNDSSAALADVVVEGYRSTAKTMNNAAVLAKPSKTIESSTTIKGSFDDSKLASNSLVAEKKIEENEIAKETIVVTSKTKESWPNTNFIQTQQGLNVTTGYGPPGSNVAVMLRGYSSANNYPEPLYIIDGKVLDSYIFKKINPNDIIDVKILKDAGATAIYGISGSNGVIIVKTKKPFTKRELRKFKKEKEKFEKEKSKSSQE